MRARTPGLRGLPTFGFATAGLLLGHALAYALAVPDPLHRDLVLDSTGHAYLPAAADLSLILALAAVAAVVARAWTNHDRVRPEEDPPTRVVRVLALVQIGAFACQEVIERLVAGAPLEDLLADGLLPIGVVVQIAVAVVGGSVLAWLARASARMVGAVTAARVRVGRPALAEALPSTTHRPSGRIGISAGNVRAPPVA